MKKSIVLLLFFLSFNSIYAQGVLDSITNTTCKCMDKLDFEKLSKSDITLEMGVCMVKAAEPYKKELKSKYNIYLDKLNEEEGEKLGKLIALKLAANCQNFKKLIAKISDEDITETYIEGTIVDFQVNEFVTVVVKDNSGREIKVLWLDYFKNSENLLTNGKNRKVKIEFVEKEIYNPKFKDYIKYKVITNLRFDD